MERPDYAGNNWRGWIKEEQASWWMMFWGDCMRVKKINKGPHVGVWVHSAVSGSLGAAIRGRRLALPVSLTRVWMTSVFRSSSYLLKE